MPTAWLEPLHGPKEILNGREPQHFGFGFVAPGRLCRHWRFSGAENRWRKPLDVAGQRIAGAVHHHGALPIGRP